MRVLKRLFLWSLSGFALLALIFAALILWPEPLFAYSMTAGRITLASDRPIDADGGARLLRDCDALLARSPLAADGQRYRLYVTNADWRHRLFFLPATNAGGLTYFYGFGADAFLSGADFATGRLVKWGYVTPPPRTLAYFCGHELTHIVVGEHLGIIASERQPKWVHEGFPDYVGMGERGSFAALRTALGDQPVDIPMMVKYGAYPRYRLLVTYFLEQKGWPVEQLLRTKLTYDEAIALMQSDLE